MSRHVLMVLIILVWGCDPIDKKIVLSNKSSDVIFFSTSVNDSIITRSPFSHAYKIDQGDTIWDESSNLVLSDSSKFLTIIGKHAWENYINKKCKDSTLRIFIFNKSLTKVPWDTIVSKQLYSKKFTYKVKDLEALNWRVEYK